jgi:hypothetical protein
MIKKYPARCTGMTGLNFGRFETDSLIGRAIIRKKLIKSLPRSAIAASAGLMRAGIEHFCAGWRAAFRSALAD